MRGDENSITKYFANGGDSGKTTIGADAGNLAALEAAKAELSDQSIQSPDDNATRPVPAAAPPVPPAPAVSLQASEKKQFFHERTNPFNFKERRFDKEKITVSFKTSNLDNQSILEINREGEGPQLFIIPFSIEQRLPIKTFRAIDRLIGNIVKKSKVGGPRGRLDRKQFENQIKEIITNDETDIQSLISYAVEQICYEVPSRYDSVQDDEDEKEYQLIRLTRTYPGNINTFLRILSQNNVPAQITAQQNTGAINNGAPKGAAQPDSTLPEAEPADQESGDQEIEKVLGGMIRELFIKYFQAAYKNPKYENVSFAAIAKSIGDIIFKKLTERGLNKDFDENQIKNIINKVIGV